MHVLYTCTNDAGQLGKLHIKMENLLYLFLKVHVLVVRPQESEMNCI